MYRHIRILTEVSSAGVSGLQETCPRKSNHSGREKDTHSLPYLVANTMPILFWLKWEHLEVDTRALMVFARDAFDGQGESCVHVLAGHQHSDMIMRVEQRLLLAIHCRDH